MSAIISKTETRGVDPLDKESHRILVESIKPLRHEQSGELRLYFCGSIDDLTGLLDDLNGDAPLPPCVLANNCIEPDHTNLWPSFNKSTKTVIILPPEVDPLELDWERVSDRRI